MGVLNNGVLDGARRIAGKFRDLDLGGGLPGAPLGLRLRGATASGPPSSGTWKAGDTVTDRNGAVWTCTSGGTPGRWSGSVVAVAPSKDVTGAKDAAAVSAALAALTATGGVVRLAATAQWYIECGQVSATTGQYIDAAGCNISAVGAGDVFRWVDVNYGSKSYFGGGLLGFPTIDGTSTTGNSCAFHGGDTVQLAVHVQANNFTAGTTSKGVWLDNNYLWTEQAYGRIRTYNCTSSVVFDNSVNTSGTATGSFDRADLDIYIDEFAGQDGVVFQNGTYIVDGRLGIFGNFKTTSAANTSAVLRLTGQGAEAASTAYSSLLNTRAHHRVRR